MEGVALLNGGFGLVVLHTPSWGRKTTWGARQFRSYPACAGYDVLRQDVMFSGGLPRFSGTRLVSFAPRVHSSNRHGSQVGRVMFARPYR
jgi:hypothetical protein